MNKIRIEGDGMPMTTRIFLDDKDISRWVQGINIDIRIGTDVPIVTLSCIGLLDIPDELNALVTAKVEKIQDGGA